MLNKFWRKNMSALLIASLIVQLIGSFSLIPNVEAASIQQDPNTGLYYKNIPLNGADFDDPANSHIVAKGNADDNTAPVHKFYVDKGTPTAGGFSTAYITTVSEEVYEGNGSLRFGDGSTAPLNLSYKVDGLEVGATYRLSAHMKLLPGYPAKGGSFAVKNHDTANYTAAGETKSINLNTVTADWKQYELTFKTTYPHAKINIWGSGNYPKVLIDNLRLEKVITHPGPAAPDVTADDVNNVINGITAAMEYNLNDSSWKPYDKETMPNLRGDHTVQVRFKETVDTLAGDITTLTFTSQSDPQPVELLVKNGDFENEAATVTTDIYATNQFFSKNNQFQIVSDDRQAGNHSLQLKSSETIGYYKTDMKPDTKYRISYFAKVGGTAPKLTFRISGYKNNNPTDLKNVMNYVEHTEMKNTSWSRFYYDIETSTYATSAYIEFSTPASSTAWIDDVTLIEQGPVDEPQAGPALSRGSKLFIEKGLQIQAWAPTDVAYAARAWMKPPTAEDIVDLGLTTVQYNDAPNYSKTLHEQYKQLQQARPELPDLKWGVAFGPNANHLSSSYFDSATIAKHDPNRTGAPTQEQKDHGFLTPDQLANVQNLNNIGFGDEENYSDTLTQILKDWFEVSKQHYPHVLVHHNEVGNTPPPSMSLISTFNEDMLRKYVRTAKPDFITYDMYYFRENRQKSEVGGTVIPFYDDLNRYRKIASEGYDGSGQSPIPFGNYIQGWRTGPGAATHEKRGDGWYEMTESQAYLSGFANWTFGAKWLSMFRWIKDSTGYLFTDSRVDENGNPIKYHIYDQFKEMFRQSKNLGDHLIRINSTDVLIVPGQHKQNGEVVQNSRPAGNAEWSKLLDRAYIDNMEVTNLGLTNDQLSGDVFIGYFDPLPGIDTTEFFTSTAPKYFMLLNGLTSGQGLPAEEQTGSSYETRQQIKVTFDLSSGIDPHKLRKVSRMTGEIVSVPLTAKGNGKYEMTAVLGGGMADLYFWELGSINADNMRPIGVEASGDARLTGDPIYAKNREIRDLSGKTVTIGWIKDTYSPIPEPLLHYNFNFTKDSNGKLLPLKNPDILSYFTRFYEQTLWNKRVERIQKESNVKLEFVPDINWTKEELMENIRKAKAGETVEKMPDVLIVPDEWTWNGLLKNDMILPASSFSEFDFNQRKWNKSYKAMTTYNHHIYGMYAGPTMNSVGLFANKALQASVGVTDDFMALQQNGAWDWNKLKAVAEVFKASSQATGKYIFADTDELFKQMVYSNQAAKGSLGSSVKGEFALSSQSFLEAAALYSELYAAGLIVSKPEGSADDWYVEQFSRGNILFLAMPYNQGVEKLRVSYATQDATIEMRQGTFIGHPALIPTIVDAAETIHPAGAYTMPQGDWVFLMFPKGPSANGYAAMIDNPAYPVMLSSSANPKDAAYVWNILSDEFTGVAYERFLKKYLNQRSADMNTLKRIGLKEGVWDSYSGTGAWEKVIKPGIMSSLQAGTFDGAALAALSNKATDYVTGNMLSKQGQTEQPDDQNNGNGGKDGNQGNNGSKPNHLGATVIKPDQLVVSKGKATVTIPGNTTEIILPTNTAQLLVQNKLEVKTGNVTLEVPSGLIKQLAGKLSADESKDSTISLKVEPLSDAQAQQAIGKGQASTKSSIKLAGGIYDFSLSMMAANGKTVALTQFEQPITISLNVQPGKNPNEVGIYYISDDGQLEFVGGEYFNGQMVAQISHFSQYAVLEVAKTFNDVPASHWSSGVIGKLASRLMITGTGESTFDPERAITRAEFTTLLVRALKLTEAGSAAFADVTADAWYANPISIAVEAGIVQGKSTAQFEPNAQITREEMVVMMMRAYKAANGTTSSEQANVSFTDESGISSWAIEHVKSAAALRLIEGREEGKFEPQGTATRAEAAQVMFNLILK